MNTHNILLTFLLTRNLPNFVTSNLSGFCSLNISLSRLFVCFVLLAILKIATINNIVITNPIIANRAPGASVVFVFD